MAKRQPSARRATKKSRAPVPRRGKTARTGVKQETARLRRELAEALERQKATGEILAVISRSSFDLQSVLDTLVQSAARLSEAAYCFIFRRDGNKYRLAASHGFSIEYQEWMKLQAIDPGRNTLVGRTALEGRTIHLPDILADPEYTWRESIQRGGYRAMLGIPLLREGQPIGVIAACRPTADPFTARQIELVSTFADQAVIAIENARLFDEVKARTADLTESLQQQTATADVLKVISRSAFDLRTVLDTLVQSAARLSDAASCFIFRREGDKYRLAASCGFSSEYQEWMEQQAIEPGRHTLVGRTALECRPVNIPDVLADPEYTWGESARRGGFRATIGIPLMREGEPIGVIAASRPVPEPFTEKQIELVSTFADQAVIAIENVRLFEEVKAKTEDLTESLQQQTATADVLKVISRSTFDLQTVLDTLVQSAARLAEASLAFIFRRDSDGYRIAAGHGFTPEYQEWMRQQIIEPGRPTLVGRATLQKRTIHIPDVLADPDYNWPESISRGGFRAMLGVPLMREGEPIGVIAVCRPVPEPFTAKQIELISTFADQAVIAIENVRLFDEVTARTRDLAESLQQQTATADVLKTISRSAFNLPAVLQTLIESAARLCEADKASVARQKGGALYSTELVGFSPEFVDYIKSVPLTPDRGTAIGRSLLACSVVHIPDVMADPHYTFVEGQKIGDYRTILCVPMLRQGQALGVFSLLRSEVSPFTDRQIQLVMTFADQAAIAIENARLFEEVQARTRELSRSLQELRAAQDRLIQTEKLASLGQLTAGIAHEIKNPLNFINNFSALSVELVDELGDALKPAPLDARTREETDGLARTLRDNLEKVVQHGQRADSIVKNMLLHSRESTGERRSVDINALVGESLNLAYHGARAERQGFQIRLDRDLDPAAGEAEMLPQEITRVLLNLISNGFYATMKRKAETGASAYEPTLLAATRNLGDRVEISIRDNGSGIPPDVKEKMFNPFFTTKPPGEGTGLGLSLSHDIVVKQHAGSIEVETKPGEFTEFRVVLPRTAAAARPQT